MGKRVGEYSQCSLIRLSLSVLLDYSSHNCTETFTEKIEQDLHRSVLPFTFDSSGFYLSVSRAFAAKWDFRR